MFSSNRTTFIIVFVLVFIDIRKTGEVHTTFWSGWWGRGLRERDPLESVGIDGCIILRWILGKWDVEAWTGMLWVRTGTGGRLL